MIEKEKLTKIVETYKEELVKHATKEFPKEACGVFLFRNNNMNYVPCKNIALNPKEDFECSLEASMLEDDGSVIIAVFHSHTNGNNDLSPTDIIAMNSCQLPYVMFSTTSDTFVIEMPKTERIPYKGRQYVGGIQDCYTLVRDYYSAEYNIVLKEFFRCDRWWDRGMDVLTESHFKEAGFKEVSLQDIKVGDVIVMQMGKKNDHLGIYLGNQRFLHHCYNRLSCEDMYGGVWLKHTTSIQRYIGEEDE